MKREKNTLRGKTLCFLGSSVTYGAASGGISFVDDLKQRDGCEVIKEAVSGTTLVNQSQDSYIARMKRIKKDTKIDLFICQLSTNDATQNKPLGEICASKEYDTTTVTGAMEYIIQYAEKTWECPVIFYTGTRFESHQYQKMVDRLLELQKKWKIGVIDLWNDPEMNRISNEEYSTYMADPIHPTREGYVKWWLPKIETYLQEFIEKRS